MTAQILIGQSHPYEGGLVRVEHTLSLYENGVARWTLCRDGSTKRQISWIPYPDTILEDGLLLLGLWVWKDERLMSAAREFFKKPLSEVEVLNDKVISEADRLELHRQCRDVLTNQKLVITVLQGSSIERQLSVLGEYRFEIEVCQPTFRRTWNVWTQSME